MTARRIAFWLLATAGVAVGHIAGYAAAHPSSASREAALGGHAYLPATVSVVIPLGVLAALGWAISTARTLGMAGRIDVRRLAVAQVGIFAVQEVVERIVGGADATSVLVERGVWLGLVAQVLVAIAITRSIDLVRSVVRLVTTGRRRLLAGPRTLVHFVVRVVLRSNAAAVAVGLRAPPVVGSIR